MQFDHRRFLAVCSSRPGVYQMYDADGHILYVGKARDLRARLGSYFQRQPDAAKTRALVARIADIQLTVTASEAEALLLEQSLIKSLRPPYNILMRDDKSFPYIRVSTDHPYPRISFHRGSRRAGGRYFGPFPSGVGVRDTLNVLEKVFQVRTCRDSYYNNRSRPCLQHEIGRCSAPCVGKVSAEEYAEQVRLACDFLDGRNDEVNRYLGEQMEQAAAALEFERAAVLRDQIASIRTVQQRQYVDTAGGDVDAVTVASSAGEAVVALLMIRQGRMLGIRQWRPDGRGEREQSTVLAAFLSQHYLGNDASHLPAEILVSALPEDAPALLEAIEQRHGKRVRLADSVRGERRRWLQMAQENAEQLLVSRLAARAGVDQRFAAIESLLGMPLARRRLECFDISHTGGELAVASCVVFGEEGPEKSHYRRFNVSPPVAGDDYAALEEAVRRRYSRADLDPERLPGLLLIDGGKGQVSRVAAVIKALGLGAQCLLLGIAKGPSRRAGMEVLIHPDGRQWTPGADHIGLHLLQQARDEAHRFAITGHRQRRGKSRKGSVLEGIAGVGPGRRRALLNHFGGLQGLRNASAEEIARAPGISTTLAATLYDWLHQ